MSEYSQPWESGYQSLLNAFVGRGRTYHNVEIIAEVLAGGGMTSFLAVISKVEEKSIFVPLVFLGIAYAIAAPLFAFLIRLCIVTPLKLHAESEAKTDHDSTLALRQRGESVIIPILLAILSVFILAAITGFLVIISHSTVGASNSKTTETPQRFAAKPLPDKIIPNPISPTNAVSVSPPTSTEPAKPFETNNPTLDTMADDAMAKLKAEQIDIQKRNRQTILETAQKEWTDNLSERKYAVEELHAILSQEATKQGQAIAKTANYFQCLPPHLTLEDMDIDETNLAEIRFDKQTNISFTIWSITHMPPIPHYSESNAVRAPWICIRDGVELEATNWRGL